MQYIDTTQLRSFCTIKNLRRELVMLFWNTLGQKKTILNVNSMFISMLEVALSFMKKYILMNGDHQTDT